MSAREVHAVARLGRWEMALLLAGLSACGRTFAPPVRAPAAGPSAPQISGAVPAQAFAGQPLVLLGGPWGERVEDNVVRVGDALAAVLAVADGGLTVSMPALGPLPQEVTATVTVAGLTGALESALRYQGLGHPPLTSLRLASDLSARPVAIGLAGGTTFVTTTRQDQLWNLTLAAVVTSFSDPTVLPLRSFLTTSSWWTLGHRALDFSDPAAAVGLPTGASATGLDEVSLPGVRVNEAVAGERGLITLGDAQGGAVSLPVAGPIAGSAVSTNVADAGRDAVAAITEEVDGGYEVALFSVPSSGEATLVGQYPFALPAQTTLGPVALSPNAQTLVILAQGAFATDLLSLPLDDAGGGASPLLPFYLPPALAVAGNDSVIAVASQVEPLVRLFNYDGGYVQGITLSSAAAALTVDIQPPHDLAILQTSPPSALVTAPDPTTPHTLDIVDAYPLRSGLVVAGFSPAGARFAVATSLPCQVAVMDAATLEVPGRGGMISGAAPGALSSTRRVTQVVWPDDTWVCVMLNQPNLSESTVCSATNALFASDACVLPLPSGDTNTGRLSTDGQGHLFASNGSGAVVCDLTQGCPTACAPTFVDGQVDFRSDRLAYTADAQYAVGTDTEPTFLAVRAYAADAGLSDGGSALPELVIANGGATDLEVHPSLPLALVAASPAPLLVDLRTGALSATFAGILGTARSGGFSPDGTRVYLGTELGNVLAYDLAGLSADGGLPTLIPEAVLHSDFPIDGMAVEPSGARLVVFSPQNPSDVLWVAE